MIEMAQQDTPFGLWPPGPDEERTYTIGPTSKCPLRVTYKGTPPCIWCGEPVNSPNKDGSKWSAGDHHRRTEHARALVTTLLGAHERVQGWKLPAWWTLEVWANDTYTLTRVDGIRLAAYRGSMMIWGWCVQEGGEHFEDLYEEAITEEGRDGTRRLPIIAEAASQFPDPADWLYELDRHYPVEA